MTQELLTYAGLALFGLGFAAGIVLGFYTGRNCAEMGAPRRKIGVEIEDV